jgi:hypothetical protein
MKRVQLRGNYAVGSVMQTLYGLLLSHKCLRMKVADFFECVGEVRKLIFEEVLIKLWQSVVAIPTGASLSRSGRLFQR